MLAALGSVEIIAIVALVLFIVGNIAWQIYKRKKKKGGSCCDGGGVSGCGGGCHECPYCSEQTNKKHS